MNESQTRFSKIDPKLRDAGWGNVPGSKVLVEHSAYIAPYRISKTDNKFTIFYTVRTGEDK